MNIPIFITFTGADDDTDAEGMLDLSDAYPIEWGILFSGSRQGVEPRYPRMAAVERFTRANVRLAAHLCGSHSREVVNFYRVEHGLSELIRLKFERVQVNTADSRITDADVLHKVILWGDSLGCEVIAQCRTEFPNLRGVQWLFDASGGRGIAPKAWPTNYSTEIRGYAGGLGPDNVGAAIADISNKCSRYWIDMESGVRDADDRFDLAKCRAVCEAVYGKRS